MTDYKMYSPPFAAIWFCFKGNPILKLPVFLLVSLLPDTESRTSNTVEVLTHWADRLPPDQDDHTICAAITYLQENVRWKALSPYLSLSHDSIARIESMWKQKRRALGSYRIEVRSVAFPTRLFRYMPFNRERLARTFTEHELYLPSPAQFNDPFDCGLDEQTRLAYIECGIGCFSMKNDCSLMYSHYAEQHRGICLGFDSLRLAKSMHNGEGGVGTSIRPVWYLPKLPTLSLETEPALCATVKHDAWSYEEEYRLFVKGDSGLLPAGHYSFDPEALVSVTFGCRASDECVSFVKSATNGLADFRYFRAVRESKSFDLRTEPIRRV